jgi:hypothetical protein
MTDNLSLPLSVAFKERLSSNLLSDFSELIPTAFLYEYEDKHKPKIRDKIYTPSRSLR